MSKYIIMFKVSKDLSAIELQQGAKVKNSQHIVSLSNLVFSYSYPKSKGLELASFFTNIEHTKTFIDIQKDIINCLKKFTNSLTIINIDNEKDKIILSI